MARKISVEIVGDASNLERTYRRASAQTSSFGRSFGGIKVGALAAVGGITTVGIAVKGFIDKATEARTSQRQMQAQLEALGISYDKHADTIDKVIQKHSQLTGIDDEDLAGAFTKIVRVTGDVNKALKLNVIAADIARARNMDLGSAAELVGKVYAGKTGILARYGIVLDKNVSSEEALAALQAKFAGQAEASATSQEKLGVAFENIQEKLGAKLLPILDRFSNWLLQNMPAIEAAVVPVMQTIGDAFTTAKTMIEPFLPILLDFGAFMLTNVLAPARILIALLNGDWAGAWDAAKAPVLALKTVVMDVINGIGPFILGKLEAAYQAALSFGGKILGGIQAGVANLAGWVGGKILDAIQAYVGLYAMAFNKAEEFGGKIFSGIKDGVGNVVGWVGGKMEDAYGAVAEKVGDALAKGKAFGQGIYDGIMEPLKALGSSLGGVIKGALNRLIAAWNAIHIHIPGFHISLPLIGDVGWDDFDIAFPDIPFLAKGGIVNRPTLAMIGESGPEAVVPLGRGGGSGVGGVVHIHVAGSIISEGNLIDAVQRGLARKSRNSGELFTRTVGVRV